MEGAQDWKTIVKENPKAQLDFQVRVHILEARELQPRDRNGMSDPVCYVELLDKKDHTVIHKRTTICTWDHLFFFEFHVLPGSSLLEKFELLFMTPTPFFETLKSVPLSWILDMSTD